MKQLESILSRIQPVDKSREDEIRAHLDNLTKPPGSLGYLEEMAIRYCLAAGTTRPEMGKKVIYTFAGDHGVTAEGISAFPKEVTPQMVFNMLSGGAGVNVLARHSGVDVRVVDMGVEGDLPDHPGLISCKVRRGTANMAEGPAMTREEAAAAIEAGIGLALIAADEGATILGTGEMGIGNTTPSSALFAVLLPCNVKDITGRGTGIDDRKLDHKIEVIERAITVNAAHFTDPLGVLAAVGGLEIAGICGLILGAASRKVPVVVDGFISSAGALTACRIAPDVKDYLFFSHVSAEAGHAMFLREFGVRPILDLGFRLGEGTGAALGIFLVEAAVKIYREMATFASAGVSNKENQK